MARGVFGALAVLAALSNPSTPAAQDFIAPQPETAVPRAAPPRQGAAPRRAARRTVAAAPSQCERLAARLAPRQDLEWISSSGDIGTEELVLARETCAVEAQRNPQHNGIGFSYALTLQATGDQAGALRLYRALSDAGYAPAMTRLGEFYRYGLAGLPAQRGAACTLWARAAQAGDPQALSRAGACLVSGRNPPEQQQMGCRFLVAAEQANTLDPLGQELRQTTCAQWR